MDCALAEDQEKLYQLGAEQRPNCGGNWMEGTQCEKCPACVEEFRKAGEEWDREVMGLNAPTTPEVIE